MSIIIINTDQPNKAVKFPCDNTKLVSEGELSTTRRMRPKNEVKKQNEHNFVLNEV